MTSPARRPRPGELTAEEAAAEEAGPAYLTVDPGEPEAEAGREADVRAASGFTEPWAPALPDVARHIPTRTRDTRTPGQDKLLGTFTPWTTPRDTEAQACIDAAVHTVISQTGPIPADPQTFQQARTAAEWRAAADIEIGYPNRDADIRLYAMLDQRAKDAVAALITRIEWITGGGLPGGVAAGFPAWKAPPPPPHADRDPDFRPRSLRNPYNPP